MTDQTITDDTTDTTDSGDTDESATAAASQTTTDTGSKSDGGDDSAKGGEDGKGKTFDETYVKGLRDEAAKARVKGKEAAEKAAEQARKDLAEQIGKALGLVKDDKPANPDELMKQLTTKDGELKSATQQLAVIRTAGKKGIGADSEALLDSSSFMAQVAKLDATAETYMADLESLIKDAVKNNPKYRSEPAVQAAAKSGGEITGGSGERQQSNQASGVEAAIEARRKARGFK